MGGSQSSASREMRGIEVLVFDEDTEYSDQLTSSLGPRILPTFATGFSEAQALLEERFFSVVLLSLDSIASFPLLDAARQKGIAVVAISGQPTVEKICAAGQRGARSVLLKGDSTIEQVEDELVRNGNEVLGELAKRSILTRMKTWQDECLRLFMNAEKQVVDLSERIAGRDPSAPLNQDIVRVLIIDPDDVVVRELQSRASRNFEIDHATSGGAALDRLSSSDFHYVFIAEQQMDLPATMIVASLKNQNPDSTLFLYSAPGPGAQVRLVEQVGERPIIDPFDSIEKLSSRLDEFYRAFDAKAKERRYQMRFKEKHYDFLRKFIEIQRELQKVVAELDEK